MILHILFFILISFLLSIPRPHVKVDIPAGFAKSRSMASFQAVSPEGMRYRIRADRNYPAQDLEFWAQALKNHLETEGYHLSNQGERFKAGAREGVFYEWILPYGSEDYLYLTAVVVSGRKILIAEAAGQHTVYKKYRKDVLESLKTISPRL